MSFMNELNNLGVDTELACKRFMDNRLLYEKMLKKFVDTVPDLEVLSYLEKEDYQTALAHAHTLKGVTGNLSLMPLYQAYSDIVALLRQNEYKKAEDILKDVLPVQESIICCIKSNQ
jgi:HPt (histidine-containing phosphotransfer) domain-containing protein